MKVIKKLLFVLLVPFALQAQLPTFNIQLSATNETCPGNGTITIVSTGTASGSTVLFKTYKLPDTATPISISPVGYVGSLTSGNYKVVAVQALGNASNSVEKNVTVTSGIIPFDFTVSSSNQNCATGATIILTPPSGVSATYEIITGPVTRPLQATGVFTGLPSGTYKIRAFNSCGTAKVKSYTLNVVSSILSISGATFKETPSRVCDSLVISNKITPSQGTISYPLTVQYRLLPMSLSGNEIHIDRVFPNGPADSLTVSAVVPRYNNGLYFYELSVTDNCNVTYEKSDESVNNDIAVSLSKATFTCAKPSLTVSASLHKAPFTVEFINAPAGFNASAMATAQAPYEQAITYGTDSNPVPYGNYVVKITDACGRVAQDTLDVLFEPLVPQIKTKNNGCFSLFGSIEISIAQQLLTSAQIVSAPSAYITQGVTLTQDVSASIKTNGTLSMADMPIGDYVFSFTDNCGFSYTVDVNVPPFSPKRISIASLPSCEAGFGSIKVKSGNGDLTNVVVTAAPAAFATSLPFNATAQVNADGELFLLSVPAGQYTLSATDFCGVQKNLTVNVEGYIAPAKPFDYTVNCGSYAVKVTDDGNGLEKSAYFLQKFNPATGKWGHPQTGNVYIEGDALSTATGVKLNNNTAKANLTYVGKLRVIKSFETYGATSDANIRCIKVLGEFEYSDAFSLDNAYTMSCTGSPNDVFIQAAGQIVSYKIEKKNGATFLFDNGTSNIFTNLEPATYLFSIEDACGNKLVKEFNLRELPSVADATQPADMHVCIEQGTSHTGHTFHLTDQNAAILNGLPSAMYTITYHLSQADADTGVNALPEYYDNLSDGQIIYARLINNHITICYGTTSFALRIGEIPTVAITSEGAICPGKKLALTATAGMVSYLWSTGEVTRTIYVTEPGTYSVIVGGRSNGAVCDGMAELTVITSAPAAIQNIETTDWTRDDNTITVTATGATGYLYSLDGDHWQEENTFTHLETGAYKVYVKDAYGCGMDMKEVVLLNYPKYFTPNGDGHHERWRIEFSALEPKLKVAIYDRYGKLITNFGAMSEGWDGTYNGAQLPSTDYWFVVTREDGRELRGHFAMMR